MRRHIIISWYVFPVIYLFIINKVIAIAGLFQTKRVFSPRRRLILRSAILAIAQTIPHKASTFSSRSSTHYPISPAVHGQLIANLRAVLQFHFRAVHSSPLFCTLSVTRRTTISNIPLWRYRRVIML